MEKVISQYTTALDELNVLTATSYKLAGGRDITARVNQIADDVLSRISATVDVSEIIEQIEELRRLIDSLGR